MVELPLPIKITENNYGMFSTVIDNCLSNSHMHTVFDHTLPKTMLKEDFFSWLGEGDMYIFSRNNRIIGSIVLRDHLFEEENATTTLSLFTNPNACNMAAISLIRGAVVLSMLKKYSSKTLSIVVSHKLLLSTIQQIQLKVFVTKLTDVAFLVNIPLESFEFSKDKLSNIFSAADVEQYLTVE